MADEAVVCRSLVVMGTFEGDVSCHRLQLNDGSHCVGTLHAKQVSAANGHSLDGSIRIRPTDDVLPAPRATMAAAAAAAATCAGRGLGVDALAPA